MDGETLYADDNQICSQNILTDGPNLLLALSLSFVFESWKASFYTVCDVICV